VEREVAEDEGRLGDEAGRRALLLVSFCGGYGWPPGFLSGVVLTAEEAVFGLSYIEESVVFVEEGVEARDSRKGSDGRGWSERR
jgi:hypothetical protein